MTSDSLFADESSELNMRSDQYARQELATEPMQDARTNECEREPPRRARADNAWLSAREWLDAYRNGGARTDEGPLRFLSNGELAEEGVVEWAIRRNVPETQLAKEIHSRQWFAGSRQARDEAVKAVRHALEQLPW